MAVVRAIIGGNGFGNEFLYLAKALTVSLDLGLDLWLPYWRGHYNSLPSSVNEKSFLLYRLQYVRYRLAGYKQLVFDHALYAKTEEVSISQAVLAYFKYESLDLHSKLVLSFPDLEVGIYAVAHRLSYLRALLMGSENLAAKVYKNVDEISARPLRIGFHIRRGDFGQELPLGAVWEENQWNTRIPLEWYANIARLFRMHYGQRVSFFLATNGIDDEISSFVDHYRPLVGNTDNMRGCNDIVDLLTLSFCDVIVTSYSWFSHWAVAFSESLFVHYLPAPIPAIKQPRNKHDYARVDVLMPDELPEKIIRHCDQRLRFHS
jgi:hypothetical protein